ncbi:hypothetical protein [Nocardiopsis sp. YSL2]|uniref:putative phage holin n=1 Tax=Nocardiopsis sp. YSL2 TaxID=2939492 RepID=UPI0026F42438|nr:hypothetical protein [Nocardiopsis sp. YSL2]
MYELGNWVALLAALLTWGFLIDYLSGGTWHRSGGGRLFVTGLVVLTALLTLVAIHLFAGDYPGRSIVRLTVYSAGALTIATTWALYRRVRFRSRDRPDDDAGQPPPSPGRRRP